MRSPVLRRRLLSLPAGDPEIHLGDRAYVDNEFWGGTAKSTPQRHLVTRTKVNMAPITCGEVLFDRNDPINTGVTRVRTVGFSNCRGMWHIVNYTAPETENHYEFLTTLNLDLHFVDILFSNAWRHRPGDVFKPIQFAFTLRRNAGRSIEFAQMKKSMPLASRDLRVSFTIHILDDDRLIRGMEWVKAGIFKRHPSSQVNG